MLMMMEANPFKTAITAQSSLYTEYHDTKMASDQDVRLHITLGHAHSQREDRNATPIWNPGDVLEGSLEMLNVDELSIDTITIYFEGLESIKELLDLAK